MPIRRFAVLAAFLSAACELGSLPPLPGEPAPDAPGTVYGKLVVSQPGRAERVAAKGAEVSVLATSLATAANDDGAFLLDGIVERSGVLLVRWDGDGDGVPERQKSLLLEQVGAGPGRQIALGELALAENARVTGRVVLGDVASPGGHAGTTIFVPHGPYLTLTADDGTWALSDLPEGPVTVSVLRAGYEAHTYDGITLRGGEELSLRTLQLQPDPEGDRPGSLAGQIVLLGTPAAEAPFAAVLTDVNERTQALTVNADGTFLTGELAAGLYRLTAGRAGYRTASIPGIAVVAGERTTLPVVVLQQGEAPSSCVDGVACTPEDPCRTGAILCTSAGATCVPGEFQIAGTRCGSGKVCSAAGACVACADGAGCTPENPCHGGAIACGSGEPVCVDTGAFVEAGAACGNDRVCSAEGICVECQQGASCSADLCRIGAIACGSGTPVCEDLGLSYPAGTGCGDGKVCSPEASCVTCDEGIACAPPNKCHVGETRCDTGVRRCADTGQPVTPGTACGNGRVCDPAGTCTLCAAGAACVPADPCHVGRVNCSSGLPECEDTGEVRAPGSVCGDGFVCAPDGSCGACPAGTGCQPAEPCRTGQVACDTGVALCRATSQFLAPGTPCGDGLVCTTTGTCEACHSGESCQPTNLCHSGVIQCDTGGPVCFDTGAPANVGDACADGRVCDPNGLCSPCGAGDDCVPADACKVGAIACDSGFPTCTETNATRPAGTSCGTDQVCSPAAACVDCAAGTSCASPVACRAGAIACDTGAPVCAATETKLAAGTTCGTDEVCDPTGACVTCVANATCAPTNACHVGRTSCASGGSVCVDTLAAVTPGTSCGAAKVCNAAGVCGDCDAGATCVPANPCKVGAIACGSGAPVCAATTTNVANGTTCGTNQVCNAGTCSACTANVACVPANPCHVGKTSCATGTSTCTDLGTNAADGTACGSQMVCAAGACTPSGLSVMQGDAQTGKTGQLLSGIILRLTNGAGTPIANENVTITVPNGHVVVPTTGKTDLNGRFALTWRVGRQVGAYKLVATTQSGQRAEVNATVVRPADSEVFPVVNAEHTQATGGVPGPALAAYQGDPRSFAHAADGTMYVSDWSQHVVRKVTPDGVISVVAGTTNNAGFSGDGGLATSARLYNPAGLALDEASQLLYVADFSNDRIRVVDLATGAINTIVGGGTAPAPYYGDGGPALAASVDGPAFLVLGPDRALWFTDAIRNRVRRVDLTTTVITTKYQGTGNCFAEPTLSSCYQSNDYNGCSLAFDAANRLNVGGCLCGSASPYTCWPGVLRIEADGSVKHIAGRPGPTPTAGLAATQTAFSGALSLAFDPDGNLFLAERGGSRIRAVEASTSRVQVVAGTGTAGIGGDFGPASAAQLSGPTAIAFTPARDLVVADAGSGSIRQIANFRPVTGGAAQLAIVSGTPQTVRPVEVSSPLVVRLTDSAGQALSGYPVNWRVVDPGGGAYASTVATTSTGQATTVVRPGLLPGAYRFEASFTDFAGNAAQGSPATFTVNASDPPAKTLFTFLNTDHSLGNDTWPGPAAFAHVGSLRGAARAADGTLYVGDVSYQVIWKITPAGYVTRFAGTGSAGFSGDGGPASDAAFNRPRSLALSRDGRTLYVADVSNARIRAIDLTTNIVRTFAGGGSPPGPGYGDSGPATNASLSNPAHVTVGPDDAVYVSDNGHYRIRRIDPATSLIDAWYQINQAASCYDNFKVMNCDSNDASCQLTFAPNGDAYLAAPICGQGPWGSVFSTGVGIVKLVDQAGVRVPQHVSGRLNGSNADGASLTTWGWTDYPLLAFAPDGTTAYATEPATHRVRVIDFAGGTARNFLGTGTAGYAGDYVRLDASPAPNVLLNRPWQVLVTPTGKVIVPDGDNGALRIVW